MRMTMNADVLTSQEAARLLGAHVETIRRMARRGAIPAYKIGKDWRFNKIALLNWSQSNPALEKKATLMVIDDDVGIRKLIHRCLEGAGYQVLSAPDGAYGLLEIQRNEVDLLLLDLDLPQMDGPAIIAEVRRMHPELPIILVTGCQDSELMVQAYRHGPFMLVPKPIDRETLLSAVRLTFEGSLNQKKRPKR
jgi:excisionase family DNA binding protein